MLAEKTATIEVRYPKQLVPEGKDTIPRIKELVTRHKFEVLNSPQVRGRVTERFIFKLAAGEQYALPDRIPQCVTDIGDYFEKEVEGGSGAKYVVIFRIAAEGSIGVRHNPKD